jgi:hypothetical protein
LPNFLRLGNRPIAKVRVSGPDRGRDAIDLVAAMKPLRAVIFAMSQRPHRMSSLQQSLDRVSAVPPAAPVTRNIF